MHEIRDEFMPEMHLRQSRFSYSACGSFTKNKQRIQKFKETGNSRYIYQNELDKVCFEYDMAYGNFKDLTRGAASDKILRDKALNIAKNWKYDGYQSRLASIVYKFFDKNASATRSNKFAGSSIKKYVRPAMSRRITQTKGKVHSYFIDNVLGADMNQN